MTDPIKLTELLTTYGVAAVAALSIMANVAFALYIKKQHADRIKEKTDSNERSLTMLEKRVEVDHKHADGFDRLATVVRNSNELSKKMLDKL